MSQARWPQLGWKWFFCRGGGPEWFQGVSADPFSQAAHSIVPCGLALGTGVSTLASASPRGAVRRFMLKYLAKLECRGIFFLAPAGLEGDEFS